MSDISLIIAAIVMVLSVVLGLIMTFRIRKKFCITMIKTKQPVKDEGLKKGNVTKFFVIYALSLIVMAIVVFVFTLALVLQTSGPPFGF